MKKIIKVLIVEDSPVAMIILKRILASSPEIQVVGTAKNGLEALEVIIQLQPDVICTDLHMAQMNGLEFTKEVMSKFPRPILVISAAVRKEDTYNVFELLQAGAVDVFPKPETGLTSDYDRLRQELINKVKVLSGVKVFTRFSSQNSPPDTTERDILSLPDGKKQKYPRNQEIFIESNKEFLCRSQSGKIDRINKQESKGNLPEISSPLPPSSTVAPLGRAGLQAGVQGSHQKQAENSQSKAAFPIPSANFFAASASRQKKKLIFPISSRPSNIIRVVAIGASTGGPQALLTILSQLPSNFSASAICVQHISLGFLPGLVNWLNSECVLPVKIAAPGERVQPGVIYFPLEGHHLEVDSQKRFVCSTAAPLAGHRPSVTVTFNSVARRWAAQSAGVLLTGMGRDGAEGMQAIAASGGLTIAQNEASSVVFGMPKEAIALGAVQHILPIGAIAPFLLSKV